MPVIQRFGNTLTRWFTLVVIAWTVLNYLLPGTSQWAVPNTGYLLGIVLFGMGLTLTVGDFIKIAKMPAIVIIGTVAHFLIMPAIAVALCWAFQLSGELALGVILVGCCPSGTSSNVMAFLARGDVALDVSIGLLSTLCAPFLIPVLMEALASQYVEIPAGELFFTALRVVLLPLVLGLVVHAIFGERIKAVTTALPLVSQIAILLIIGAVVSANHEKLLSAETAVLIPVVMLHNLIGFALGYLFSKVMFRVYPKGFRYAQQKAITFEVGMQDSALGATLALQAFAANPFAAIPSTFFSVWHNISGSMLASLWRRHDDKHRIAADSKNGEPGSADLRTQAA